MRESGGPISRNIYRGAGKVEILHGGNGCKRRSRYPRRSCSPRMTTTCVASSSRRCRTPVTTSVTSTTGKSAYERLREEPFELLLTDIVMPEMDGIELARRATELDPDIKVMFITGFAAVALNPDNERAQGRQGPVEAVPPARSGERSREAPERGVTLNAMRATGGLVSGLHLAVEDGEFDALYAKWFR